MRTLIVVMVSAGGLLGQPQDSKRQNVLLSEVHELRLAIERSSLLGTRLQISLQRIQMQEMRTTRFSQDHDRLKEGNSRHAGGLCDGRWTIKGRRRKVDADDRPE